MVVKVLMVGVILLGCSCASAEQLIYEGSWKTTNRKLDGAMTCVLTPVASEKWKGRFFGRWQGVDFDYTVAIIGPADKLRGTATIDGAEYEWKGWMKDDKFKANFGGDRYIGSFELQKKKVATPAASK